METRRRRDAEAETQRRGETGQTEKENLAADELADELMIRAIELPVRSTAAASAETEM
jgi:hypothetical protein